MRPIAPLLLFVSFCSCTEPSLNMNNEKQVHAALRGRWESTHLETGAGRMEVPKEMVAVITYEESGSYDARKKNGVIATTGKWTYHPKTHRLNINLDAGVVDQRIVKLTNQELIITNYTYSNDKVVDSLIETYRKL